MGPVLGVRLWQPCSQGSLLPVQERESGNKIAITWGRRKEIDVSEKEKKNGVEIYNTYGPLFKRSLTKGAV